MNGIYFIKIKFDNRVESHRIIKSSQLEVKPFLKWVGGKRKLIPRLEANFPDYIKSNEFTYVTGEANVAEQFLLYKYMYS